ncbi:MAG: hypothetical protein HY513_01045 [Candidatus Aenigmarchaeota archaeon]|nr:hypothetical protein [Candidatus Aenigmarchaeota archaeon]
MIEKLTEIFGGRSAAQHASPVRWYFDTLFPQGPCTYFREPNSAPQIVIEHNGVKYVVQRIGKASICMLGRYDPDRQPEGEDRYGFDPIANPQLVEFDIDKRLREEAIKLGYDWHPKDAAEQANFALAESLLEMSRKLGEGW